MAVLFNRFGSLVLVVFLTACSTLPKAPLVGQPVDSPIPFVLEGRMSVTTAEENLSGKIAWRHQEASDQIDLSSPFGQKLATMIRVGERYQLIRGGMPTIETQNVDRLTASVFGKALPVREMPAWVLGVPAKSRDVNGPLPYSLTAPTGWTMRYDAYQTINGRLLPTRMRFSNSDIAIQIVVDRWQLLP